MDVFTLALAGAGLMAYYERKRRNIVFLVYTDPRMYRREWLEGFAKAMKQEWGMELLHRQVTPPRKLETIQEYQTWQKQLGMQDYNTIFIAPADPDLFNPNMYDAYVYPEKKIGFMEEEYGVNSYLICHEALHMWIYAHSGGRFSAWSKSVHACTNVNPRKEKTCMVDVDGGKLGYKVVPLYDWR